MSKLLYTQKDGLQVFDVISNGIKTYCELYDVELPMVSLIGSLTKPNGTSTHDIDILLDFKEVNRTRKGLSAHDKEVILVHLKDILKTDNKVVYTDWGGLYFCNTFYGDVDVFFEMPEPLAH